MTKRTTIKDVAREAGVSITTVSHALNGFFDVSEKTKARIFEVARRLNYAPDLNARSLGGRNYKMVALLVSDLREEDESGQIFGILSGLHSICEEFGGEAALLTTSTAQQKQVSYIQLCRSKNIDAVVIAGLRMDDPYYSEIMASEIPCAMVDSTKGGRNVVSVNTDNARAAEDAVNRLVALGHRRIAMINGTAATAVSADRLRGYLCGLKKKDIPIDESLIRHADFEADLAFEQMKHLLRSYSDVTACFCASDIMAVGALRAARFMNVNVPRDVSIMGFDDIPAAKYIEGGISTIRQNFYLMGREAGRAVFSMLNGDIYEHEIFVPYEIIERKTTSFSNRIIIN